MTKENYTTETFRFHGFLIDIVTDPNGGKSAWLYHPDCCIKSMMWGQDKPDEDFMELVEWNAPDYIPAYIREFLTD